MVFHTKNNFLILGFTGPLRSGCTTAAKFYYDNPKDKITEFLSVSVQEKIEKFYKEISNEIEKNNYDYQLIKEKKAALNELLRKRELKKCFQNI